MHVLTTFIATVALASAVIAKPNVENLNTLQKRDYATVNGVLKQLTTDLNSLTKIVNTFDGQVINAVPVLDAAAIALKTMKEGTVKITGQTATTDVLGIVDTLSLLGSLYSLDSSVGAVTKSLVTKKPQFEQALVGFVVADQLISFQAAAKELVNSIVTKLPAYLPTPVASVFYNPILNKLDAAVKQYPSIVTKRSNTPMIVGRRFAA
jgi:hypothetical protein